MEQYETLREDNTGGVPRSQVDSGDRRGDKRRMVCGNTYGVAEMRLHRIITHGEEGNKPRLIIIHAVAERVIVPDKGVYDAPDFMEKSKELIGSRVSAHSIIMPSGLNVRMRHDNQTAWHARGYNENSLGIEFTVPGEHDYESFLEAMKTPYLTEDEYQAGLYQVREWMSLHDIQEIARHCDKDPYRKLDPGDGFPWEDFLHDLGE